MIVILMTMFSMVARAKSFGVIGEVFPVIEKSFLKLIEERLKAMDASGELDKLQERWVNTVATHANRPLPLNLGRANKTSTHYYLPEIRLSKDITDSKGNILYAKGACVNALQQLPAYSPCWLFFNADDEAQVNWAQKQTCPHPKFILTGGSIRDAEKRLQAVIYFDQAGAITDKLTIQHVPAKVSRSQNRLLIEERAIKENGDVL